MITEYDMTTGAVLDIDGETNKISWSDTHTELLRLQTVSEAEATAVSARIPADLVDVPVAQILARLS
jgi:hypothetical protein